MLERISEAELFVGKGNYRAVTAYLGVQGVSLQQIKRQQENRNEPLTLAK